MKVINPKQYNLELLKFAIIKMWRSNECMNWIVDRVKSSSPLHLNALYLNFKFNKKIYQIYYNDNNLDTKIISLNIYLNNKFITKLEIECL